MILATHALVGAALGKNIDNPWLIVPIALVIHFILDSFRHGEYINSKKSWREQYWKVALDILIGFSIIALGLYSVGWEIHKSFNILLGTFFCMFPDLLTVLYWVFNWKFLKKIYSFHGWVHRYPPFSKEREWNLKNATNDIIFSLIAIFFLFY